MTSRVKVKASEIVCVMFFNEPNDEQNDSLICTYMHKRLSESVMVCVTKILPEKMPNKQTNEETYKNNNNTMTVGLDTV